MRGLQITHHGFTVVSAAHNLAMHLQVDVYQRWPQVDTSKKLAARPEPFR